MSSGTTEYLLDIWGTSATDVFACGWNGTILHYDGVQWRVMDTPVTFPLCALLGNASNDVYSVGYVGTILHYDGAEWTKQPSGTLS